ncbi:hypothetical protein NIES4071_101560 (plasmid) [Calothrix sp. NIES-4071]|nr:hypothetical protein NIES4071_101560 [Calothrix sp. NIES-4071]BAZ64537.1 hypothetical protein NIES4105_102700 [Calothrix sp. NIES-4105]
MPKKKCGFGFSCASMMMQPGLEVYECPNYRTCSLANDLTVEEEVELIIVRQIQTSQKQGEFKYVHDKIRINRRQAAIMMLMSRACPQSLESLSIHELINQVGASLDQLRSRLTQFEGQYIAPESCEVHSYNVKRPRSHLTERGVESYRRAYQYNKLTAMKPIFEPFERQAKVRVIHLSRSDDPRNLEAREGIERRNKVTQVRTKLKLIEQALADALALL